MEAELLLPLHMLDQLSPRSAILFDAVLEEWEGYMTDINDSGSLVYTFRNDIERDAFVAGYNAYAEESQRIRLI
jgi:hypothetical protein